MTRGLNLLKNWCAVWPITNKQNSRNMKNMFVLFRDHFDGLVQERHKSITNALELRLSCSKPSILCIHPVNKRQHCNVTPSLIGWALTWTDPCFFIFIHHYDGTGSWNLPSLKDNDLSITHSQYNGCWCPGDTSRQGISSHGIDLVLPGYSSFSTRGINQY